MLHFYKGYILSQYIHLKADILRSYRLNLHYGKNYAKRPGIIISIGTQEFNKSYEAK